MLQQAVLQRLQQYITLLVLEEGQVNPSMHSAMDLMALFHQANRRTEHVPLSAFYNDAGVYLSCGVYGPSEARVASILRPSKILAKMAAQH